MVLRNRNLRSSLALCVVALAAIAWGAGCDDETTPVCQDDSCSGHGTCSEVDGTAVCECEEGYTGDDCSDEEDCAEGTQDHDGDGECLPDCETADLDCEAPHECDDSSGEASCECAEGYTGAECDECDDGYQDNDEDGACEPDCETAELTCEPPNECDDSTGVASCECAEGYAGADCTGCAPGYQDNDDDGSCEESCAEADLDCGPRQHCEDGSGEAECIDGCAEGYTGDDCDECADGYQDNDDDGTCLPDCVTAELSCPVNSACDESGGAVACLCDEGYQDNDDDGSCTPDCATAGLVCAEGHVCDDAAGAPACVCDGGYQDNDGDGVCEEDCVTAALDCSGHGACDDTDGTAGCACDVGWDRDDCSACKSPYYRPHYADDGVTLLGCETSCYYVGAAFECDDHEVCAQDNGIKACVCTSGYQDNDEDGACTPTCAAAMSAETDPLECPENATCSDASGTATCGCRDGYADDPTVEGVDCLACAEGYQDNDDDGTCAWDCTEFQAAGHLCGAGGCDDTTGTAHCVCAEGEQDNDDDGECLPDCEHSGLTCDPAGHLRCGDESGEAECVCDEGFFKDYSGVCVTAGLGLGDSCSAPMELALEPAFFGADVSMAVHDFDLSCAWWPTVDVVYHVNVPAGETYDASATVHWGDTAGNYWIPIVGLFAGPDCATATEVGCGLGVSGGYVSQANLEGTLTGGDAGTDYYLVVGGTDYFGLSPVDIWVWVDVERVCPAGQVYSAVVGDCVDDPCAPNPCTAAGQNACVPDLSTATPDYDCHCNIGYVDDGTGACVENPTAEGEGCADVLPIPVVADGTITGDTSDAIDDGEASCSGSKPARDRVYGFSIDRQTRLNLSIQGDDTFDTLMHIRRVCDDPESQVLCYDVGAQGSVEGTSVVLDPGSYYLFVDGWNERPDDSQSDGEFTLDYSFHENPCFDEEAACPGEPVCRGAGDWSTFECVCEEAGTLPSGTSCVDDPCGPEDPCADELHQHCVADLAAGTASCECDPTWIEDGAGGCRQNPDAQWTVITYWALDNNLSPFETDELLEYQAVPWNENVRQVVFVDLYDESYIAEIIPGGMRVLERFAADPNTGDFHTLRDFGIWAVENYPAEHYVLHVSGHGGEWRTYHPDPNHLLSDDDTGDIIYVTTGDWAEALQGITDAIGDSLDIIIHNDCLQGEFEMAEANAPYADYMIGAPSSMYSGVENDPWRSWYTTLAEDYATMTPRELAVAWVDAYQSTPTLGRTSIAAYDLSTMGDLEDALSAFADALVANESVEFYQLVDDIRWAAQTYDYPEVVDIGDFLRLLIDADGTPAGVVTAANELVAQLDETIVLSWANPAMTWLGYMLSGSTGMSIYLPSPYYSRNWRYTEYGAVWSANTTWDEFLGTFADGGVDYYDCGNADTTPAIGFMGETIEATLDDLTMSYSTTNYLVQTFLAPGREIHSVRIAVRKTVADAMEHEGFQIGVRRPGEENFLYGPYNLHVDANGGEVQYLCFENQGARVEPGEVLRIELFGGKPHWAYSGSRFATPIEWPIDYAASADAAPPYADGEVLVNTGSGEVPIGEYNGDGIPGTLWFEVY